MQKLVVHKVGVMSLAKLVGVWGAILGVVIGVISAVVSSVGVIANNDFSVWGDILAAVGIVLGWVIVYPLVMFLLGWIQGAVMAVVFNVVVAGSGGLDLEVAESKLEAKK